MNHYPIAIGGDTAGFSSQALEVARTYPELTGVGIGLVGGYLFKHPIAGALFGFIAGKVLK